MKTIDTITDNLSREECQDNSYRLDYYGKIRYNYFRGEITMRKPEPVASP